MKLHVFTLLHMEVGIVAQCVVSDYDVEQGEEKLVKIYNELTESNYTLFEMEVNPDYEIVVIEHEI